MDGDQAALLRLHSLLGAANQLLENLIRDAAPPLTEAERLLASVAIQLARTVDAKSLAEGVRWAEAYHADQEAWAVIRSVPGDNATVTYFGRLSREQRQLLGR